jgi:hypothetical protein
MHIETGTLMKIIYQRAERWIRIDTEFIKLRGRLFSGG